MARRKHAFGSLSMSDAELMAAALFGLEHLSLAKNMSMLSRFTFRKNSPFACWSSFCGCFGSFDCWVLGIKPSLSRT
jgi:hypothetical protein